ncbi:MAG: serine/threonine protein kinase [Deltaproteobacteria bacterium]|nr:serine/threonine protein kinase [Deltaproteobacteria bacterium]
MQPAALSASERTVLSVLPTESPTAPERGLVVRRDVPVGSIVAGRYTVTDVVGSGGVEHAYRAFDATQQREVALEVLWGSGVTAADGIEHFVQQARVLAMLSHPNVVQPLDFGRDAEGGVYLVMDLPLGTNLRAHLRERGRLPWPEVCAIASPLVQGLQAAHERGVVHGELRPANVLLGQGSTPDAPSMEVLDFGIASARGEDDTDPGVARYLAPEQAQGLGADARSDIYRVGVVLFEMLTGRTPFVGDDVVSLAQQQIGEPVPSLSEAAPGEIFDPLVEEVVMRALAKDKADRYASMAEFEAAIESTMIESTMALMLDRAPRGFAEAVEAGVRSSGGSGPVSADRTVVRRAPATPEERRVPAASARTGQTVIVRSPLLAAEPGHDDAFDDDCEPTVIRRRPTLPRVSNPAGGAGPVMPPIPVALDDGPTLALPRAPSTSVGTGMAARRRVGPAPAAPSPAPIGAPVFAQDANAPWMHAELAPMRVSAPHSSLGELDRQSGEAQVSFGAASGATGPVAEEGVRGAGVLQLRPPRREASRNRVVATVIMVAFGLATVCFAVWTMLRQSPGSAGTGPHPAAIAEQPRPIMRPAQAGAPLEIPDVEPVGTPPPLRQQPERVEEAPARRSRTRRRTGSRPVASVLSRSMLDAGFARSLPAIRACGRKHGAIEGTHLDLSFDVVERRALRTSVQPPHGPTPLGSCVVAAVRDHARFSRSRRPSRDVQRRMSF